jgi:hypothetical protein
MQTSDSMAWHGMALAELLQLFKFVSINAIIPQKIG